MRICQSTICREEDDWEVNKKGPLPCPPVLQQASSPIASYAFIRPFFCVPPSRPFTLILISAISPMFCFILQFFPPSIHYDDHFSSNFSQFMATVERELYLPFPGSTRLLNDGRIFESSFFSASCMYVFEISDNNLFTVQCRFLVPKSSPNERRRASRHPTEAEIRFTSFIYQSYSIYLRIYLHRRTSNSNNPTSKRSLAPRNATNRTASPNLSSSPPYIQPFPPWL